MSKQEAINILIANAVCSSTELYCDTDCPFYEEDRECKYVREDNDFELKEAVNTLKGGLI